jgi:uncharacterized protein YkwD
MKSCILAALGFAVISGGPASAQIDADSAANLLAAHNEYRSSLNLPPLQWSGALAAKAQIWADHIAATGQLAHSGPGQNLAWATAGGFSLTQLVELWGNEKANFTNGNFPTISSTGNWMDAGHYSQLVWAATRLVGCGFATGSGHDILVCDYDPPGNVMGGRAY